MGEVILKYQPIVESWEYEEGNGYRYFMYPKEVLDYFGIDLDEKVLMMWMVDMEKQMYVKLIWGEHLAGGIEE